MIYRVLLDSIEFVPVEAGDEADFGARPGGTAMRGAFTAGLGKARGALPMPVWRILVCASGSRKRAGADMDARCVPRLAPTATSCG
jgi:hypothetical protein